MGDTTDRLLTRPFLIVSGAVLLFFLGVGVNVPVLPRLVERELDGGRLAVGTTVTTFAVAAVLCRPALARFGGRRGPKVLMVVGCSVTVVALAGQAFVETLPVLFALRALAGVGDACLFVGAATIANTLAPPHRRAEAASYQSVAVFGGIGLGPLIGDRLAADGRFAGAAFLAAALTAAALLVTVAGGVDVPRPAFDPAAERPRSFHLAAVPAGVVLAFAIAGYTAWSGFIALRADEIGAQAGLLFASYSAVVLVLRLLGARVPERVGLAKCAAGALVFLALGLLACSQANSTTGLLAGTLVLSLGVSLQYPALSALSIERAPEGHLTAVVGTFTMFFEVGSGLGGLLAGAVAAESSYQGGFLAGAACALAGLVVLWIWVVVPRRRDPSPSAASELAR